MITVSACLIVKNEEKVLARCLDCVQRVADEIIIVDTGSTDRTKEIASRYTNLIYDFKWVDDFSAARNFSFSKASMDYLYVVDADEIIEEEQIHNFLRLKETLLPEIEIVQMYYCNQLEFNTTYNFDKEYRPKLYKRVREFRFYDPLHEAVRLDPVIYDSEIEIVHKPLSNHAPRDFATYQKIIARGEKLSDKLRSMYARELFIAGEDRDFIDAYSYFYDTALHTTLELTELKQCQCVLARGARLQQKDQDFFKVCLKNVACGETSSEICFELGEYYLQNEDELEAILWYYNAAFETEAELNLHYQGDYPLDQLALCYHRLGNEEEALKYEKLRDEWKINKR
jgi:glycosyltransferase involved in cell wall biosynthesis